MFVALIKQAIKFGIVFLYGSTGEIIIEKSGHLNLGIPGVMCFGAIGGCLGANLARNAGLADSGIIFVAILMAMLFGAMMGVVYGLFTITLRCNQNVTGLTITTFGTWVLGLDDEQRGHDVLQSQQSVHRTVLRRGWNRRVLANVLVARRFGVRRYNYHGACRNIYETHQNGT